MQRFALPIALAITALLIGIGIGRYTVSSAGRTPRPAAQVADEPATSTDLPNLPAVSTQSGPSAKPNNPAASTSSAQDIIAKIKAGLTQSNSRRAYATFSKLAELIDASNVRDVLAFVQTLPKPEEKNMLVALFIGRWAELDPASALAYAQALPAGQPRNWAITSAITGWA